MKHIDLFSGYGGFTIPAKKYGIETIAFSEIDKYASAVLAFNFRGIKNYGDITKIDFRQFNGEVDLITGGTPCQDLSVAGKQKGLKGKRSGLFFEFIRAITESNPKYFIWENVKGALSSNKGWDMARVQIEMAKAGYDVEWVVYNAKDFGVPQNRERIFAIGTRGESRREVLPEPTGTGQTPKRVRDTRAKVSDVERVYYTSGSAPSQKALGGGMGAKTGLYAIDMCECDPKVTDEVRTIQARYHKGYSNRKGETSGILEAKAVLTPDREEKRQNGRRFEEDGEPMFTLTGQDRHGVMISSTQKHATHSKDVSPALTEAMGKGGGHVPMRVENMRIRRLTPTECERLMGLPDGWTSNNGEISDTQRYKMCGNGVVVNVVDFIYNHLFGENL